MTVLVFDEFFILSEEPFVNKQNLCQLLKLLLVTCFSGGTMNEFDVQQEIRALNDEIENSCRK